MSSFIANGCCRGKRPSSLSDYEVVQRPRLLTKLLRDRASVRFIVAPSGYGKTSLVLAYADMMFSFEAVTWVNGSSPCFVRDLDDGTLLASFLEEGKPDLVVVEDVSLEDEVRQNALSQVMDGLLEVGCEVIVTMAPAYDGFGGLQKDRLRVGALDLLVGDDELDDVRDKTLDWKRIRADHRVPCCVWGSSGETLLARCVEGGLAADQQLFMVALSCLGQGRLSCLGRLFDEHEALALAETMARDYPHLGIDLEEETFSALPVSPQSIRDASGADLGFLARNRGMKGKDSLVSALADLLVEGGSPSRGALWAQTALSAKALVPWLESAAFDLCAAGGYAAFAEAHRQAARGRMAMPLSDALMAWATLVLRDPSASVAWARKALASPKASWEARVVASLALRRAGNTECAEQAHRLLESLVAEVEDPEDLRGGASSRMGDQSAGAEESGRRGELRDLAREALEESLPVDRRAVLWLDRHGASLEAALGSPLVPAGFEGEGWCGPADGTPAPSRKPRECRALESCLAVAASIVAAAASQPDRWLKRPDLFTDPSLLALVDVALRYGEHRYRCDGRLSAGVLSLGSALDRHKTALASLGFTGLSPSFSAAVQKGEADLARQGAAYRRSLRDLSALDGRGASAHGGRPVEAKMLVAPETLSLRFFGGVEARIGDRVVPLGIKAGRKVIMLMAVLALHRGRELTRSFLVDVLWPKADTVSGEKSFYRLWRELVNLFGEEGECPYFHRTQSGCSMDPLLVSTDVERFEGLTRDLMFGGSRRDWAEAYRQVQGEFAGEFLPGDVDNDYLCSARDRFSMELVDGLVSASRRLVSQGSAQGGLWLAREALRRSPVREDAYAAVMEAEVAAGQRASAVETFFRCKGYLADSLGLDPSDELMELYEKIIR